MNLPVDAKKIKKNTPKFNSYDKKKKTKKQLSKLEVEGNFNGINSIYKKPNS